MKNSIKLFEIYLLILLLLGCRTSNNEKKTTIFIDKIPANMGNLIFRDTTSNIKLKYKNTGNNALIIYDIETGCGCTIPEWSKKPLKPDDTGFIFLKYKTNFPGVFRKTILVHYNGINSPDTIVLKGSVEIPSDYTGYANN